MPASSRLAQQFAEIVAPGATLAIGSAEAVALFTEDSATAGANRNAISDFMVEDVEAAFDRLNGKAELVHAPKRLPWGNRTLRFGIRKVRWSASSCRSRTPRRLVSDPHRRRS